MMLKDFMECFQGVYPASMYTCSKDGIPNGNYISHVYYIDEKHVAVSGQFLNKTRKNLSENPYASVMLVQPRDICHVELELYWKGSETSGDIFDRVAERIDAIDSQIGADGKWKLVSIEVFEVTDMRIPLEYQNLLENKKHLPTLTLQNLQLAISEIQKSKTLEEVYDRILLILETSFGFKHTMILVPEEGQKHLVTINSRGYSEAGIGAEVVIGEGIIGKVAQIKRPLAFLGLRREMIYAKASIRDQKADVFSNAIELPRLSNALSQIAIPLLVRDELLGVLQLESVERFDFKESDEEFLMTFGSYVALILENFQMREEPEVPVAHRTPQPKKVSERNFHVAYYKNDDCIFIDGEYLIRNIPAKLLWKILTAYESKGQTEFSNRELRLDPALQLPEFKDNLETRLILLRRRLEKKCPSIGLPSCGRGKFHLQIEGKITLEVI